MLNFSLTLKKFKSLVAYSRILRTQGLLVCFMFLSVTVLAQVKIGDKPKQIYPGSLLELESSNRGVLFPRIKIDVLTEWTLQTESKEDQKPGMVVYNTSSLHPSGLYVWYNNRWNLAGGKYSTNETLSFTNLNRTLDHTNLSTIIPSGIARNIADEAELESIMPTTTEGDIYYIDQIGLFIRNNNSKATTVGQAYLFLPLSDKDHALVLHVNSDTDINTAPTFTDNDGYYQGDVIKKIFGTQYITYVLSDHDNDPTTDIQWVEIGQDLGNPENLIVKLVSGGFALNTNNSELTTGAGQTASQVLGEAGDHLVLVNALGSPLEVYVWDDDYNDDSNTDDARWVLISTKSTITNVTETTNWEVINQELHNDYGENITNNYNTGDLVEIVQHGDTVTYHKTENNTFEEYYTVKDNDAAIVIPASDLADMNTAPTLTENDGYYQGDVIKKIFGTQYITYVLSDHDNDPTTDLQWVEIGHDLGNPENLIVKLVSDGFALNTNNSELTTATGQTTIQILGNAGDHLVLVNALGCPLEVYVWDDDYNDDSNTDDARWVLISTKSTITNVDKTTNWEVINKEIHNHLGDDITNLFQAGDLVEIVQHGDTITYHKTENNTFEEYYTVKDNDAAIVIQANSTTDMNTAPTFADNDGYYQGDVIKKIFGTQYITYVLSDHDNNPTTDLQWVEIGHDLGNPENLIVKLVSDGFALNTNNSELTTGAGQTAIQILGNTGDHLVLVNALGSPLEVYVWDDDYNDDSNTYDARWVLISTKSTITTVTETTNWEVINQELHNHAGENITNNYNTGDLVEIVQHGDTITYHKTENNTFQECYTVKDNDAVVVIPASDLADMNTAPTLTENDGYYEGDVIKKTFANQYVSYILNNEGDWIELASFTLENDLVDEFTLSSGDLFRPTIETNNYEEGDIIKQQNADGEYVTFVVNMVNGTKSWVVLSSHELEDNPYEGYILYTQTQTTLFYPMNNHAYTLADDFSVVQENGEDKLFNQSPLGPLEIRMGGVAGGYYAFAVPFSWPSPKLYAHLDDHAYYKLDNCWHKETREFRGVLYQVYHIDTLLPQDVLDAINAFCIE